MDNKLSGFLFTPVILRSAALFIIMFQLRLIASDLADTSIFTVTLLGGFASAVFLSVIRLKGKTVNILSALVSIALIPWAGRIFIAIPRLFVSESVGTTAIILDSMLLNLDRNNFVSLFPFYWSAVTTWFALRAEPVSFGGRKFLRAAVIADTAILLFLFSAARTARIEIYRWPIVVIILFSSVIFLQALALLYSMPRETKLRVKEIGFAAAALFLIVVTGGFLFLKPFQAQAAEMGGGLLEPNLFSFDFSRFLRLDSEISMKNDLILIVKKENDNNILLRRSVHSGYSRRQGFYKLDELDEKTHPQRLPDKQVSLEIPEIKSARLLFQEYFLVNFESTAFIGIKEPVTITPYEKWDASSFNSVYAVESYASYADFSDLSQSAFSYDFPALQQLGLSEYEYTVYTEYGNDERLLLLAEDLTFGIDNYALKVAAIYQYFKYGDFRYSLKPGIAPDGDQLGRFIFQTKRGYCSYYAFAMTLLLRSLGIPTRVVAGFFIDPDSNTFDYYPVRSDMAHSWVEVAFPGYGWIEFDPTTEQLAEDEDFQFSSGPDPVLFERLMREIIENRSTIRIKDDSQSRSPAENFGFFTRNVISFFGNYRGVLLAAVLIILFLYIRCGIFIFVFLTKDPRKKSIRLLKHAFRRLRLAGLRTGNTYTESEWALLLNEKFPGIYPMYQSAAAARFAPCYDTNDLNLQWSNYKTFCVSYRRQVSFIRRLAGWIFPLLAIAGNRKFLPLIFIVFFFCLMTDSPITAQDRNEIDLLTADGIYNEASDADFAEFWERAIDLYREGSARFPDDWRFPWSLGNLYFNHSLYNLAWDEYRKTEILLPGNPGLLIRLARTAGYLNLDHLSVDYYEQALEIEYDNWDAICNLAWMYFKVHRLADGERLLLWALDYFGDDPDLSMTLGTVYSDMYRYHDSKYWYSMAIKLGDEISDRLFTSIAWYNLSILETRFYRFDLSLEAVNNSLSVQNRSSGRLALVEILMRQLELEKAQKENETAYEMDTSPLSKLNLANVYQVSGRLEEARLYAEDCLKNSDNSWMLYFGIDPNRYKRDIHWILASAYSGLSETERLLPWASPAEKMKSLLRYVSYKLQYEVNIRLYRKYCLAAANAYSARISSEDGAHINYYIQYYRAFYDYPRRAVIYLNKAREFIVDIIPEAVPSYDLEEGVLTGNMNLVEKALFAFDPLWEREGISQCYKEFAKQKSFSGLQKNKSQQAAQELFALNRSALRQAGIKLPVQINVILPAGSISSKRNLEKAITSAGFKKTDPQDTRFTLTVRIEEIMPGGYMAVCELIDDHGVVRKQQHSFPLRTIKRADSYYLARSFANAVFITQ